MGNIRKTIRTTGIEGIIDKANYDWETIDLWLKKIAPKTYRIHRLEFRQVFNDLQKKTERKKNN